MVFGILEKALDAEEIALSSLPKSLIGGDAQLELEGMLVVLALVTRGRLKPSFSCKVRKTVTRKSVLDGLKCEWRG